MDQCSNSNVDEETMKHFFSFLVLKKKERMNEMAKFRYRSRNQWNCGGVTPFKPLLLGGS